MTAAVTCALVSGKSLKKSLNSAIMRIRLCFSAKRRREFGKIDRSDSNQGDQELGEKGHSGSMPSKCCCQDVDEWAEFSHILLLV